MTLTMAHKRATLPGRGYPPLMFVVDNGVLRLMGRAQYIDKYLAGEIDFPPSIIAPTQEEYLLKVVRKEDVTRELPGGAKPTPAPAPSPTPVTTAAAPADKPTKTSGK